jgi:hypothetical protein
VRCPQSRDFYPAPGEEEGGEDDADDKEPPLNENMIPYLSILSMNIRISMVVDTHPC